MEPQSNPKLFSLNTIRDKVYDNFVNNKLHHSLIIVGKRGIGKATLCYHIANKILNFGSKLKDNANNLFDNMLSIQDDTSIDLDENNSVFNLIKEGRHPDLLVISKDSKSKEIKIESKKQIIDFISLTPLMSHYKIIIIDSVDEMNVNTQNSILKILEEPIDNTYFLLVCHNKNNILDTIQSRCFEIDIPNYNFETWKQIVQYVYSKNIKTLTEEQLKIFYNISDASILKFKNIYDKDGLELYNKIQELLNQQTLNIEELHKFGKKLKEDEIQFGLFSNFIILYLYNALRISLGVLQDDSFKNKNFNFLLKNNTIPILIDKIKMVQNFIREAKIYNLDIQHLIIVLFNELNK